MNELLLDLYGHQAWADAEHWHAFELYREAFSDSQIWRRLNHLHQAQRAFFLIARGVPLDRNLLRELQCPEDLKASFKCFHVDILRFLRALSDSELSVVRDIPFAKVPDLKISVSRALLQGVTHSHYHRGQNATRLREIGGNPPVTDLISWYANAKPEPVWFP